MSGYVTAVIIGMGIACVIICILVKRYYQSRMEKIYGSLLQRLDRAMGGEMPNTAYDESMDAAVAERLNRIVQIYGMNQERAEEERNQIKSLISDISHQVRTPLTNIMLYTGLLQEQDLAPDARILAEKIEKQSDKLEFI